jgi:Asp-tRNA(Asn)/Glu-tRNA(Gln) amidotransferase A subunit family amidase
MPLGLKDTLDTHDMPTEYGSAAYRGHQPVRDNATVGALRDAGAVFVGKTVTTELTGTHPGPTTNPHDPHRTPGGSSSGSAAAVGAGMVPVALGTQLGGSIIRPSAYCGVVGFKPSQGAVHRGDQLATSQGTLGTHAMSVEDAWLVAMVIATRVGGDPGWMPLKGPMRPPVPVRPERLIVLETPAWETLDSATRTGFETFLRAAEREGVELLRKDAHPLLQQFEDGVTASLSKLAHLVAWEMRGELRAALERSPDGLSERARSWLAEGDALAVEDYVEALAMREEAQLRHGRIAQLADAVISPSAVGPAPIWNRDDPDNALGPSPTGSFLFNATSSNLFSPAVNVPRLSVDGVPVGIQVFGQPGQDARIAAIATWLMSIDHVNA